MVLKGELYATTCLVGATVYVLLVPFQPLIALAAGMSATLVMRLGAIKYQWSLTVFRDHQDHY